MVHPFVRKRFGQNFLCDTQVIDKILSVLHPKSEDNLVEVGPGRGALTQPLLLQGFSLDVVEIDRDLIVHLKRAASKDKLVVHEQNALKMDFGTVFKDKGKIRVFGNLPYNISTPLLFHLLKDCTLIEDMHFMLQKEVVDRMCAEPGTSDYGRLTVMVQSLCQTQALFEVPPKAFRPAPKVFSKFIRLTPYHDNNPYPKVETEALRKVVTTAFSARRKTLRNGLKNMIEANDLEKLEIEPDRRPETITIEEYIKLSNFIFPG